MDIKKLVIWLVILTFLGFAVAGISFGRYFASGAWEAQKTTFSDEKVLDIKDARKINIRSASSGVRIVPTDEKQVKVTFDVTGLGKSFAVPTLKAEAVGDVINIEVVNQPGMSFKSLNNKLEIAIPTSYEQNLSVEVLSGSTAINGLKLNEFKYKGASGGLRTEEVTVKNADISVMSGSIKLAEFTGDLQAENSSGQVDVEYKEYKNNKVNIKGMSGSIKVVLPADAQFTLDAATMSGTVACDFPIILQGSSARNMIKGQVGKGGGDITLNNASGSIRINK